MDNDFFMGEAITLAKKAAEENEVPVGCVIVKDDVIIGRGRNGREREKCATSHAEINAIEDACRSLGGWRLSGCRLYVTLEPCPMCAGAIISSRIPEIFFGARDPEAGACGSVINLFEEKFNHHPKITGGILEEQCLKVLRDFFKTLRDKN